MTARTTNLIGKLKNYSIDPVRGFLPAKDPLQRLPQPFADLDQIGAQLPKLLVAGQVKTAVSRLKLSNISILTKAEQLERAMMLLSFIGHAYVWGDLTPPANLPANLAVPWHAVASRLGRPPVLSYASYALHNWRRIDAQGPIALGNIALLQNFLGGVDEEWFILVHIDIEAKAAPLLSGLAAAQRQALRRKVKDLAKTMHAVAANFSSLHAVLARMPEWCDPYIYFNRVRPYIHGWKNHPQLPDGLIYDGVTEYAGRPQRFRGETGAQSSIVPALDGLLDVAHKDDPLRPYLLEMQDYMPPGHRAFIHACEIGPSLRASVIEFKNREPALKTAYNECIDWLEKFRSLHLDYADRYIYRQSQVHESNPSRVGTGGTPFIDYLRKHRDETGEHRIA